MYKVTMNLNHRLLLASNLLDQDLTAVQSNSKWVSAITYIDDVDVKNHYFCNRVSFGLSIALVTPS